MIRLSTPIHQVKGIGPKHRETLNTAGIFTVEDLLHYKPFRYEDRTHFKPIRSLQDGEYAVVQGMILLAGLYRSPKKGLQIFELAIRDDSGVVDVKFFNQPYLKNTLKEGERIIIYGQAKYDKYKYPQLSFINPEHEIVNEDQEASIHTGRVVPIYRRLGDLSGKFLRRLLHTIIADLEPVLFDILPAYLREKHGLVSAREALLSIHFPVLSERDFFSRERVLASYNSGISAAHRRLIFEEFFQLQVGLIYLKRRRGKEIKGRSYRIDAQVREAVKNILHFHPTQAQKKALKEIVDDMCSTKPMHRLLQGEVGSGKTIVALQAMVIAIENGYQTALMAPTEILAEQHFLTIKKWLKKTNYRTALLTSRLKRKEKQQLRQEISNGTLNMVIGTHAIIQEGVTFKNLGFIVIDEQHRFGVIQRADLIRKGFIPDTLVMTATPIPRSLSLTLYGDLDTSIIDELPAGRRPIKTILCPEGSRSEVYRMMEQEIRNKHQVYVVYPLVEESEKLTLKAATQMAEHLASAIFPRFRVGLLHGQMKSSDKEKTMEQFADGDIDILVSTIVIEVGIDVPNATLMVIEHAERFGLAQLHQLRGRVGRGKSSSECVLLADSTSTSDAQKRLQIMCQTNDGFKIAEMDLEIRGPGEFTGTRQSGLPELKFGNLVRDRALLELARDEAIQFLDIASAGKDEKLVAAFNHIKQNWHSKFGLALVG